MSLLKTVKVDEAEGKVKEIYEEVTNGLGKVPNIIQLCSINPDVLEAQWANTKSILSMDKENKKLHIIIRLFVSDENNCEYCTGTYSAMLINMFGMSEDDLVAMKKDPTKAPLSKQNIELLLFTLKAVDNPHDIKKEDIEKLEEFGFSQKEIFDAVYNASNISILNTLSNTFKVVVDF